jgi:hypothetical protein
MMRSGGAGIQASLGRPHLNRKMLGMQTMYTHVSKSKNDKIKTKNMHGGMHISS